MTMTTLPKVHLGRELVRLSRENHQLRDRIAVLEGYSLALERELSQRPQSVADTAREANPGVTRCPRCNYPGEPPTIGLEGYGYYLVCRVCDGHWSLRATSFFQPPLTAAEERTLERRAWLAARQLTIGADP